MVELPKIELFRSATGHALMEKIMDAACEVGNPRTDIDRVRLSPGAYAELWKGCYLDTTPTHVEAAGMLVEFDKTLAGEEFVIVPASAE